VKIGMTRFVLDVAILPYKDQKHKQNQFDSIFAARKITTERDLSAWRDALYLVEQ
jgi:hypothetical protein